MLEKLVLSKEVRWKNLLFKKKVSAIKTVAVAIPFCPIYQLRVQGRGKGKNDDKNPRSS